MISSYLSGLGIGAGLIIAIGAQNAFVLGCGLRRQHPFLVAGICAICDAVLISIGVAGLGGVIARSEFWTEIMAWGGAAFLIWYGFLSFRNIFRDQSLKKDGSESRSRKQMIIFTLCVTLLNPHVYIDTVLLLGGVSAQFASETARFYFALGAISASLLWFSFLSIGAVWAAPYLARPITWKIIDALTAFVMWAVAASLIL